MLCLLITTREWIIKNRTSISRSEIWLLYRLITLKLSSLATVRPLTRTTNIQLITNNSNQCILLLLQGIIRHHIRCHNKGIIRITQCLILITLITRDKTLKEILRITPNSICPKPIQFNPNTNLIAKQQCIPIIRQPTQCTVIWLDTIILTCNHSIIWWGKKTQY